MKKIILLLIAVFALISCNNENETDSKTIEIESGQSSQTVYADDTEGVGSVTFKTTDAWTSEISESSTSRSAMNMTKAGTLDWISINPASGNKAGSYTINITLTPNYTGEKRTATITISCKGSPIEIMVEQQATTKEGNILKPEQPDPSGSGMLKNETTGQTINLVGVEHSILSAEKVGITFIGETQIIDEKEWQESFTVDFYNPLQDGKLKAGVYTVQPINVPPYPEMGNGDCGWWKSSLFNYGEAGTVKVEQNDNVYTFTFDVRNGEGEYSARLTGTFTGMPKYLNEEVKVASISLSESSKTLAFGSSFNLEATILPENTTDKRCVWSSDNTGVATVSEEGLVSAIGAGKAIITVTSSEGGKTATCEVTVTSAIAVESIKIEPSEITLLKGAHYEPIQVTVLPENATDKNYDWASDDESIAEFDGKGGVWGNGVGTTYITLTTKDGAKTAKLKVTVQPRPTSGNGTITTSNSSGILYESGVFKVDRTILAKDEVELKFIDDRGYAVSQLTFYNLLTNGRLTSGDYTVSDLYDITGTSRYGKVKSPVWVRHPVSDIGHAIGWMYYYQSGSISVSVSGDTYTITFNNVKTNSTLDFESETITGSYTGKLTEINEYLEVSSVQLDKSAMSLDLGQSEQLTATINPANAFNQNVTWSSSNPNVATVSDQGSVWANGVGTATITVTTEDGAKTASCMVTVKALPTTGNGTFSNTNSQSITIQRAVYQINGKMPEQIDLSFYSETSVNPELNITLVRSNTDTGILKAGTYSTISYLSADKLGVKYSATPTGTVVVGVSGDQYTITLDVTAENGSRITGSYSGKLSAM